jgi:hypothetical protein
MQLLQQRCRSAHAARRDALRCGSSVARPSRSAVWAFPSSQEQPAATQTGQISRRVAVSLFGLAPLVPSLLSAAPAHAEGESTSCLPGAGARGKRGLSKPRAGGDRGQRSGATRLRQRCAQPF